MAFLGIDLGTTFIKGAVLNLDSGTLDHPRRIPFPDRLPTANPLHWEYDPQAIVAAARQMLDDLALHAPACEGIVMSAQMHGLILTNAHGQAVGNCVTWRDQRVLMPGAPGNGSYFDEISARLSGRQRRQLGRELEPSRPLCTLFWLRGEGRLAPDVVPLSIPDFVLSRLCGAAPGVEATHAGAYGAFNLETLDWHHEVIAALGLADLNWPPLRPQGQAVGSLRLGNRDVPGYTPVGDFQCSLAGALIARHEISLNISTGAQVSRLTPTLCLGDYQTRPYFDGQFLSTFTTVPGGRTLDVLVNLLAEPSAHRNKDDSARWTSIAQAVRTVNETDLKIDLSFFPEAHQTGGAISNIREDNFSAGHLVRAAFNDMAEKYYASARRLWPDASWKNLVFSGGVAIKLDVLREIIQKRFAATFRMAPVAEDALFGLLILARVFSGRVSSVQQATQEFRSLLVSGG